MILEQIFKRQFTDYITNDENITELIFQMKNDMEICDSMEQNNILLDNVKEVGIVKIINDMLKIPQYIQNYNADIILMKMQLSLFLGKHIPGVWFYFLNQYYDNMGTAFTLMKDLIRRDDKYELYKFLDKFYENVEEYKSQFV